MVNNMSYNGQTQNLRQVNGTFQESTSTLNQMTSNQSFMGQPWSNNTNGIMQSSGDANYAQNITTNNMSYENQNFNGICEEIESFISKNDIDISNNNLVNLTKAIATCPVQVFVDKIASIKAENNCKDNLIEIKSYLVYTLSLNCGMRPKASQSKFGTRKTSMEVHDLSKVFHEECDTEKLKEYLINQSYVYSEPYETSKIPVKVQEHESINRMSKAMEVMRNEMRSEMRQLFELYKSIDTNYKDIAVQNQKLVQQLNHQTMKINENVTCRQLSTVEKSENYFTPVSKQSKKRKPDTNYDDVPIKETEKKIIKPRLLFSQTEKKQIDMPVKDTYSQMVKLSSVKKVKEKSKTPINQAPLKIKTKNVDNTKSLNPDLIERNKLYMEERPWNVAGQKKKKQSKATITGTGRFEDLKGFQGYNIRNHVYYVGKFDPQVGSDFIQKYISKLAVSSKIEELCTHIPSRKYRAYKVTIDKNSSERFCDPANWPAGVNVTRWNFPSKKLNREVTNPTITNRNAMESRLKKTSVPKDQRTIGDFWKPSIDWRNFNFGEKIDQLSVKQRNENEEKVVATTAPTSSSSGQNIEKQNNVDDVVVTSKKNTQEASGCEMDLGGPDTNAQTTNVTLTVTEDESTKDDGQTSA
jgi:hypothetical protein